MFLLPSGSCLPRCFAPTSHLHVLLGHRPRSLSAALERCCHFQCVAFFRTSNSTNWPCSYTVSPAVRIFFSFLAWQLPAWLLCISMWRRCARCLNMHDYQEQGASAKVAMLLPVCRNRKTFAKFHRMVRKPFQHGGYLCELRYIFLVPVK